MIKLMWQIGQGLLYKTGFIRQGLPCYVVDEYRAHTQYIVLASGWAGLMGSKQEEERKSQILQKKCDVEGRILMKGWTHI